MCQNYILPWSLLPYIPQAKSKCSKLNLIHNATINLIGYFVSTQIEKLMRNTFFLNLPSPPPSLYVENVLSFQCLTWRYNSTQVKKILENYALGQYFF